MYELRSLAVSAALVQLHLLRFQGMNLKFFAFGAWAYKCWAAWFIPWLHIMAQYLETHVMENSSTSFDGLYCNTSWESHRWCICHHYPSWQHPSFTDWGPKNNGIKGWVYALSKFTYSKMMHYPRDNGGISIMRQTNASVITFPAMPLATLPLLCWVLKPSQGCWQVGDKGKE